MRKIKLIISLLFGTFLVFLIISCGTKPHTHQFIEHEGKEPTCIEDGYEAYVECSICGYSTFKEIKAEGHDYGNTLFSNGLTHYYECLKCHTRKDEEFHQFSWIIDKDATEDETGLQHEECDICNYIKNEKTIVEKLPHSHKMTRIEKVNKTCNEDGNIEYYHCNKCNKNYLDENGINEVNDIVIKASHNIFKSSKIKNGITTIVYTCNDCNYTYEEELMINETKEFTFNYTDYAYPTIIKDIHNYVNTTSLDNLIDIPTNCLWTLSKDNEGKDIVSKENIDLSFGHNYFYITLFDETKEYSTVYLVDLYRLNTYTYTFMDNERILKSRVVEEKAIIEEPNFYLSKKEHTLHWKDSKSNEDVLFPYLIKSDVTFVSNWVINKYKVSFDTNGGNDLESIDIDYGETITLPTPINTSVNNEFVGWEYDNKLYKEIQVLKNINLKTIWTKDFKVELLADGNVKIVKYYGNDKSVVFPQYTTCIGENAFEGSSSITSIEIPSNITNIGKAAFKDCNNLTSMTIPFIGESKDTNTFLGYIFGADDSKGSSIYVPTSLKEIKILDDCTIISHSAFSGCINITSIKIPNTVTCIENFAFNGCSSLTSIIIPSSVTSIYSFAFTNTNNLASIIVNKDNKVYDSRNDCNAIIETKLIPY